MRTAGWRGHCQGRGIAATGRRRRLPVGCLRRLDVALHWICDRIAKKRSALMSGGLSTDSGLGVMNLPSVYNAPRGSWYRAQGSLQRNDLVFDRSSEVTVETWESMEGYTPIPSWVYSGRRLVLAFHFFFDRRNLANSFILTVHIGLVRFNRPRPSVHIGDIRIGLIPTRPPGSSSLC